MKKLTAGIFTALLGLVTVNAANAAIPSTSYVNKTIDAAETAAKNYADTQDAALKQAIETDYKAADTALGGRIDGVVTAYEAADTALDGKITANTSAISAMDTAYKAADSGLSAKIGSVDFEGKLSSTDLTSAVLEVKQVADTATGNIGALGSLASKSVVTNDELDANLQATVAQVATNKTNIESNDADILDLQGRMTTAEGEIDTLQGNVQTLTNADSTNLQAAKDYADGSAAAAQAAAEEYADGLNTAADGRLDALEAKDITLNTAIETNKAAIESNDSDIAGLKEKDTELAGLISDNADAIAKNAEDIATKADATETSEALATKANSSDLKALAYKDTVANADVAEGAEIAQSKIAGLTDALAGKMPVRAIADNTISEAGTYVLTATQTEKGVINYTWERIDRLDGGQAE